MAEQNTPFGEMIRAAREEKGWTQSKLAEVANVSQTTIDKIERGLTLRSRFINDIVEALEIRSDGLPEGSSKQKSVSKDDIDRDTTLEVFPTIEGLDGWLNISPTRLAVAGRPSFLRGIVSAYCLYVSGTSMVPEFEPSDIVYINPVLPPIPDTSCVFKEVGKPTKGVIRRILHADEKGWLVRRWNPIDTETLDADRYEAPHRIVGKYSRR